MVGGRVEDEGGSVRAESFPHLDCVGQFKIGMGERHEIVIVEPRNSQAGSFEDRFEGFRLENSIAMDGNSDAMSESASMPLDALTFFSKMCSRVTARRYSLIASLMFLMASCRVSPSLTQPGSAGQVTVYPSRLFP